jgi:D-alanyl-D-alanine carboxypeptidase
MRVLALTLGLKESDFSNPHGASGNTSSALDMAKLAS